MGYFILTIMMLVFTVVSFICIANEYYFYGLIYFIGVNLITYAIGYERSMKENKSVEN